MVGQILDHSHFVKRYINAVNFLVLPDALALPHKRWVGWKKLGYEVIHGSKALFGCSLIWGSKGDGASYNASFFGRSQVQAVG